MEVNPEVAVVAINKSLIIFLLVFTSSLVLAQDNFSSQAKIDYKKRVLEKTEIDMLSSFYTQDGDNAAVTGGIGTEQLNDFAQNIKIMIPLNDDDVLSIDATISAYTSASSSNLNPFSGASTNEEDDDDEDDDKSNYQGTIGSPWIESSGASKQDVWSSINLAYSHSSNDRNNIWSINFNLANEYDYSSLGFGSSFAKLFNEQNTELSLKANVFLDKWRPKYPTEISEYVKNEGDLSIGFFAGIDILNQSGEVTSPNKNWSPVSNSLIDDKGRNSYSLSFSFSQILTTNAQVSIFADLIMQSGWLANPMQRVYFADRDNYFIGNPEAISIYTSKTNKEVFQLADDIERLPQKRLKTPLGLRFNYYLNEYFVLRHYYRYYHDDWGMDSHTAELEIPIKINQTLTLYPSYRFYKQTKIDYFNAYEENLSTSEFYTSDNDLSDFNSSQLGFGIQYTDIFSENKIWNLGLKNISLSYSYGKRNTGLYYHIISLGTKFNLNRRN